jgi:nicotinate-nucleotide--dimethylbenzimidazole phosphoribosyltransferase
MNGMDEPQRDNDLSQADKFTWPRPVPLVGDRTSAAERGADPNGWAYSAYEQSVFYSVVGNRRDIRRYRHDAVAPEVLERIIGAAHAAPSVGHSQPWRFIVVQDEHTRDRAVWLADRERLTQAAALDSTSSRQMLDLQLEGIREAPLGLVVCCDRRAAAEGVLGRATYVDADMWSCACAIENLWLAARAEGLGVGWVTLFRPEDLASLLSIPDGVQTLGWLCIGWPDERPPEPGLERAGWSRRLPAGDLVMRERWEDGPAPPISRVQGPGSRTVVAVRDHADRLLTPVGSLGVLDRAVDRLAALRIAPDSAKTLVLAAADHPVVGYGVSTFASAVTREVLDATVSGVSLGAVAARAIGAAVVAVDAGVEGPPVPGAQQLRPAGARGDLVRSDALSSGDVESLLSRGRSLGLGLGGGITALGEVGIGNTTVAAALTAALLDLDASEVVGLGVGGDTATIERKQQAVRTALARARSERGVRVSEPLVALACLGGPELAVLAGVALGAAEAGALVVMDGLATSVAVVAAVGLEPAVTSHLVAGQDSRERAHRLVLTHLGCEPLLSLRLRAGEGVGAVLATQMLATAAGVRRNVATVDEHGPGLPTVEPR